MDSIASEECYVPIPSSHSEELDRRLADYEEYPGSLLTLEDLQRQVETNR